MMSRRQWILSAVLALTVGAVNLAAETAKSDWGNIPLAFESNRGQAAGPVRFMVRGNGYGVFLTEDETVVGFTGESKASARMIPVGRNPDARLEGVDLQPGSSHYFIGANSSESLAAPRFARVLHRDVWRGIDMMYYISGRQLEYDFIVAPGAPITDIRLDFSGGALSINRDGDLLLRMDGREVRHRRPVAYQESNGTRRDVAVQFQKLGKNRIGFQVGTYDPKLPLIIDPKLDYSTYWGGTTNTQLGELGYGITVDAMGYAYVTGLTAATDFPVASPLQGAVSGGTDAFVVKLSPDGNTVVTSTYIGGSGNDEGHDIKVDAEGSIYITGYTYSTNFPIVNGFQRNLSGSREAYLAKLSGDGSQLLYSTYIGGSGDDRAYGLSVSPEGDAYVTGSTESLNFPIRNALQPGKVGGLNDAFVTKIARNGTLAYSTYLGGSGVDLAYDIAISPEGGAYVVGYTTSVNFPRIGLPTPFFGGPDDAFAVRLDPAGQAVFALLLGGIGSDEAVGVALDADLNVYVTGYTASVNFPTWNALQPVLGGAADVFVTRLHADGTLIDFSTFWGSTESEGGVGIAIDSKGFVVVTGFTGSFSFPIINAFQDRLNQGTPDLVRDAFLLKLTGVGDAVAYSTYLGGRAQDGALGLALDPAGNAYVTGYTASAEFPVATPLQPSLGDLQDAFIVRFNASDVVGEIDTLVPGVGISRVSLGGVQRQALFGWADVDVTEGSPRPAGLELIQVEQLGVTVTELGLPLTPPLQHARLFVESMNPSLQESIAIVNSNDAEVTIEFFFTYTILGSDGMDDSQQSNVGTVIIQPRQQAFVLLTDYPFFLSQGLEGTLTLNSSAPISVTAVRALVNSASNLILSRIPVHDLDETLSTVPSVIDHFVEGGGWHTQIVLINNTDDVLTGEFRFNGMGNAPSTAPVEITTTNTVGSNIPYRIPPRTVIRTSTTGFSEDLITGFIEVVPDPGSTTPDAFAFLEHNDDTSATLDAQTPRDQRRVYAEAQPLTEDQLSRRFALGMTNSSNAPATVLLELFNPDGSPTGYSGQLMMPERTQISRFLDEIPGFEMAPAEFKGVVKITVISGTGVTATGVQSMVNELGTFIITTTGPVREDATDGVATVFPYLPTGAQYKTSLILISPASGAGTSGKVRTWSSAGAPLFLLLQ
ncbi:MAG TPA: SBBP repeat-containing protein [Terriglobia bacterium]|nr:SBBP repeat-containing protein [Terriglobia bacterium]